MADRDYLERATKELVDAGKLVEAGWIGLRLMAYPPDAPPDQLRELRQAFFAGAQHLFASIITFLEEGDDATDSDLDRMSLVHAELDAFIKDFEARHIKTKGSA